MSSSSAEPGKLRDVSKARIESIVENNLKICCFIGSKERTAWYLYDAANSLFSGFAMTMLVPLLLVKVAEHRAYEGNDGSTRPDFCTNLARKNWTVNCAFGTDDDKGKCVFQSDGQPDEPIYTRCRTCVVGVGKKLWNKGTDETWQLTKEVKDVPFLGLEINYLSYATWVVSISVLIQAVVFIVFAPFADYGEQKKRMLLVCAFLGAMCSILFVAAEDQNSYITVGILTILANVFFGLSLIAYNAFLPILVDAHGKLSGADVVDMSASEKGELGKFRAEHGSEMSSKGYIYGYVGQLVGMIFGCAIIAVGEYLQDAEERENNYQRAMRLSMMFVGLWWLLWSLPALLWLKPRASPPLPIKRTNPCSMAIFGLCEIWKSLCLAKKYFNTWRMLATFFFYSDMYNTITYVGVLVAEDQMCFDMYQLIAISFLMVVMSIIGGYSVLHITKKWGVSAKGVIVTCLAVYAILSCWFTFGIWSENFGFHAQWEVYCFAVIHGFILGPIQSYSRVLFADFIPLNHESSFFSMYAITDKGSSWLGPCIVGIVANANTDLRYSGFYLLAVSLIPALVLHFFVDHEKGMADVGRLCAYVVPIESNGSTGRDSLDQKLENDVLEDLPASAM